MSEEVKSSDKYWLNTSTMNRILIIGLRAIAKDDRVTNRRFTELLFDTVHSLDKNLDVGVKNNE